MPTRTISIRVSDEAARTYESASDELRRKLDALLTIQITTATRTTRSLEEVIADLSRRARERGLTEEVLDQILDAET
jgi:hypothetical protein